MLIPSVYSVARLIPPKRHLRTGEEGVDVQCASSGEEVAVSILGEMLGLEESRRTSLGLKTALLGFLKNDSSTSDYQDVTRLLVIDDAEHWMIASPNTFSVILEAAVEMMSDLQNDIATPFSSPPAPKGKIVFVVGGDEARLDIISALLGQAATAGCTDLVQARRVGVPPTATLKFWDAVRSDVFPLDFDAEYMQCFAAQKLFLAPDLAKDASLVLFPEIGLLPFIRDREDLDILVSTEAERLIRFFSHAVVQQWRGAAKDVKQLEDEVLSKNQSPSKQLTKPSSATFHKEEDLEIGRESRHDLRALELLTDATVSGSQAALGISESTLKTLCSPLQLAIKICSGDAVQDQRRKNLEMLTVGKRLQPPSLPSEGLSNKQAITCLQVLLSLSTSFPQSVPVSRLRTEALSRIQSDPLLSPILQSERSVAPLSSWLAALEERSGSLTQQHGESGTFAAPSDEDWVTAIAALEKGGFIMNSNEEGDSLDEGYFRLRSGLVAQGLRRALTTKSR